MVAFICLINKMPNADTKPKKICPDGTILNVKTNRCNKIKSKPKKICPDGTILNVKTNICNKIKSKPKKICPDGTILNEKTNRCNKIKSNGEVAKKKKLEDDAAKKKKLEDDAAKKKKLEDDAVKKKKLEDDAVKKKKLEDEAAKKIKLLEKAEANNKKLEDDAFEKNMKLKDDVSEGIIKTITLSEDEKQQFKQNKCEVLNKNNNIDMLSLKTIKTIINKILQKTQTHVDLTNVKQSLNFKLGNNKIDCKSNEIVDPNSLKCINKNSTKAKQLVNELNMLHFPFTFKKGVDYHHILLEHPSNTTFAAIYLAHKYTNDCVIINNNIYEKSYMHLDIDKNFKGTFTIPHYFWNFFFECKKTKRFIISPLAFSFVKYYDDNTMMKKKGRHANYIIYDTHLNEIERYEPHGFFRDDTISTLLDKTIKTEFEDKLPNVKYISPLDFCPRIGYQKIECHEENLKLTSDIGGFCSTWSTFYADLRLGNPNKSRDDILILGMALIKNQHGGFKTFVRDYAKFISSMRKKYIKGLAEKKHKTLDEFFFNELKAAK